VTSGPEWLDPVGDEAADRDAGAVQAALLTTYDPRDATLLVEDVLPRWFWLDREMSSDDAANRFFLAELEVELQGRRGGLEQLCEQAADDMAHAHAEASAVVTRMMPQLPGLTETAGHAIGEAQSLAGGKITSALNQISSGRSLLPMDTALLNLCNLMGEKMKINRFDAMKIYENL